MLFWSGPWVLLLQLTGMERFSTWWVELPLFIVVRAVTERLIGSLGNRALGIDSAAHLVDPTILRAESWVTILVGVVLVREGAGTLVNWCQARVPLPFFGFTPSASLYAVIAFATGVLTLLAGYWFLRLNARGL